MFPIGEHTALCQACHEAEADVSALVIATRTTEVSCGEIVLKYVAVALLAYVDVVGALSGIFIRAHRHRLSDARRDKLFSLHKDFNEAKKSNDIEKRLRDYVRNLVSAHRHPQTSESESKTYSALRAGEFRALFHKCRALFQEMESIPVWTWGRSSRNGIICMICAKRRNWQPSPLKNTDGFDARLPVINQIMETVGTILEKEFSNGRDAIAWADSIWRKVAPGQPDPLPSIEQPMTEGVRFLVPFNP